MPKKPEQSKKTAVFISSDQSIISLKEPDQPITAEEKAVLNNIYNESVLRLKRTARLLNELETYLSAQPESVKQSRQNIKQYLIDNNADPDILHTLKMLKRHFYIDITNNTMNAVLAKLQPIRNNSLRVYKGLQGQLDINIQVFAGDPNQNDINLFKPKTYVFALKQGQWELSYYENGVQKNVVNIDNVDPNIKQIQTVTQMQRNENLLMRVIMLYHAKQSKTVSNKVYISNISKRRQNDPRNLEVGYVWSGQNLPTYYFGALHIDYRFLTNDPFLAMGILIHEAAHLFAWVNDSGYYHQTKNLKAGGTRPYPNDAQANTLRATNNADSYRYLVQDMTGSNGLLLDDPDHLPDWFDTEKFKPLPQESSWNGFKKFGLFCVAGIGVTLGTAVAGYWAYKNNIIKVK